MVAQITRLEGALECKTVPRVAKLSWIAALAAPMLSCTLLVQFHDQPDGGDVLPNEDAGIDATADRQADAQGEGQVEAEASAVDTWNPCLDKTNGWRCGNNGLDDPLPDADLVYCNAGTIGSLTVCDAGCLHVVDPFPDSCNPCGGVANGDYCGRDLPGFNQDNADILIICTSGEADYQDACAHGCGSNGKMSACYP